MSKHIDDLKDSIEILEENIRLFEIERKESAYRPLATELRKLIADASNSNPKPKSDGSLMLKLNPSFSLHPVRKNKNSVSVDLKKHHPGIKSYTVESHMEMFGAITFSGNGQVKIDNLFDTTQFKIPLKQWRCQKVFFHVSLENQGLTVFELIKGIADKESAHSDAEYDKKVSGFNTSVVIKSAETHEITTLKKQYIVAIAKYLLGELKSMTK